MTPETTAVFKVNSTAQLVALLVLPMAGLAMLIEGMPRFIQKLPKKTPVIRILNMLYNDNPSIEVTADEGQINYF